jgi:hypothetical protein
MGSQDLTPHLLSLILTGALLLEEKAALSLAVFIVLSPQNLKYEIIAKCQRGFEIHE